MHDILPPITFQDYSGRWHSKEKRWLAARADTHWTSGQMAAGYGTSVAKLNRILPPHDTRSPHGSRTRLWRKGTVIALLGEPTWKI